MALKCDWLCSEFGAFAPQSFAVGADAEHVVRAIKVLQQLAGLGQGLGRNNSGHGCSFDTDSSLEAGQWLCDFGNAHVNIYSVLCCRVKRQ